MKKIYIYLYMKKEQVNLKNINKIIQTQTEKFFVKQKNINIFIFIGKRILNFLESYILFNYFLLNYKVV